MQLEISRADIAVRRLSNATSPATATAGTVVLAVEAFALTANNVSYALAGEMLDYWGFFPAAEGWGRLPVMGFGTVVDSGVAGVDVGARYFGFFPAGDHHVVEARPSRGGFLDIAAHRASHAKTYRSFELAGTSGSTVSDLDHRVLLLRGLFATSFLCDDYLGDNAMFGAGQLVVTSASSKTSLALAHEARRNRRGRIVGVTSAGNRAFVEDTGLYDSVVSYDEIGTIDASRDSVIVDMAGSAAVLSALHGHLEPSLRHSCQIGATHWRESGPTGRLPGPRPSFFFAPSQIAKRAEEWGREVLDARLADGLAGFVEDSRRWMNVEVASGGEGLLGVYDRLLAGAVDPAVGNIIVP